MLYLGIFSVWMSLLFFTLAIVSKSLDSTQRAFILMGIYWVAACVCFK